jgi:hypothetical protein
MQNSENSFSCIGTRRGFVIPFLLAVILISSLALVNAPSDKIGNAYAQGMPTLSQPANLSNGAGNATNPDIFNVGTHLYIAWAEGGSGLLFRESPDGGTTWSPPLNSSALNIAPAGRTSAPLISANGSNVYVVWSQTIGTTGAQIVEATSTNYGASFGTPIQITSGTGPYITPVIASWGTLVAVAYDKNGASYVTTSLNNGSTWGPPQLLSTNHEPQLAVWQSNVYAIADPLFFAVSNNAGANWTVHSVGPTGSEGWLAAYGNNVYAAWETKNSSSQVYVLVSNDSWAPMVWAYGSSAWVALHTQPGGNDSTVYVYTTKDNGSTWSTPIQLSKQLSNYSDTSFPFTIASSNGLDVFTAWSQQLSPTTWNLMVSYSNDGGTTWIAPSGVNVSQNPNGTSGSDNSDLADGAITSFGSSCYAVWQLINQTSNQVYFASLVYPTGSTTTTSTSSQSSTTSMTSAHSTTVSSSTSNSVAISSSSTTSSALSTSSSGTASSIFGIPTLLFEAGILAVVIVAAIAVIAVVAVRRRSYR